MFKTFRIALLSVTAAAALANAATYRFDLPLDATIEGQVLKAGSYSVDVNDTTAVIKAGKKTVETKVKVETTAKKNDSTSVKLTQAGGKYSIEEIHLGGKKMNLVFEPSKTVSGGF